MNALRLVQFISMMRPNVGFAEFDCIVNYAKAIKAKSPALRRIVFLGLFAALIGFLWVASNLTARAEEPDSKRRAPTRLIIPAIDLETEIIPVGANVTAINGQRYLEWDTADEVVGWHNLTAKLGQPGNTVLAGHSDIFSRIFENLDQVKIGDDITVMAELYKREYRITDKLLVQEANASPAQRIENGSWINSTDDERITLITCAYPGATHRLIVVAKPIMTNQPVCAGCPSTRQLLEQLLPFRK